MYVCELKCDNDDDDDDIDNWSGDNNGDWTDDDDDAIPNRSGFFIILIGLRTAIGKLSSIMVDSSSKDWFEVDSWSLIIESSIVESFVVVVVESSAGTHSEFEQERGLSINAGTSEST